MRRFAPLAAVALMALVGCGATETVAEQPQSQSQTIVDMEGRTVELPTDVDRVVTLGSVPVINSFLFALGEGEVVVNGLPEFAANPRWKYQGVFHPGIEDQPRTQNTDGAPDVEAIIDLDPDVVLTMSPGVVPKLEEVGLNVVVLQWRDAEDVTTVVDLLGDILDQPERAQAYRDYFGTALQEVDDIVAGIDNKVTALHLNPISMTRPHLISEWWIGRAGGLSVASEHTGEEILNLDVEQIIAWDPQVIFVNSAAELEALRADQRLVGVSAVRENRIHSIPIAAHTWGNRTSEQPLTVMWTATKLYPEKFADFDLPGHVGEFYRSIYHVELTDEQVTEILGGM